jgi:hypothetical protein
MRTGYLSASSAAAALMLTVFTPATHAQDAGRAYCLDLTHRAVRMNAQAGKWIDRFTRHDGVSVNCEDQRVEVRRFVAATPASMGDDWEDRKEREWNATQCSNPRSREAIERGWTVRAVYTTAAGRNVSFDAECD